MLSKRKAQAPPAPEKGNAAPGSNRDGAKQKGKQAAFSHKKYDGAAVSSTGAKRPAREKGKLQTVIAHRFAGETPAQRADHLEIALRYAWNDRDRAERLKVQKMPKLRLRQLERLFARRCGATLPDDDCGRDYLRVAADHIVQFGNPLKHIAAWAAVWAPWIPQEELADLIESVIHRGKRWRAGALGRELRLTEEERRALKITTIRPHNLTKADLIRNARQRKRAGDAARRRRAGALSRVEYEGRSAARNRPWEALGISRRTWYRRRYQVDVAPATTVPDTDEDQVAAGTSPRRAEEGQCWTHTCATGKDAPLSSSARSLATPDIPIPIERTGDAHRARPGAGIAIEGRILP